MIAEGLRSKDGKERAIWARVLLSYRKQKRPESDRSMAEPFVLDIISLLSTVADGYRVTHGIPISLKDAISVIREHMVSCPTSPASAVEFEEITDDDLS